MATQTKKRVFPKHVSTYDRENHRIECHLRELLTHYHVPKKIDALSGITFLTDNEMDILSDDEREQYAPMTQQQLAILAGIRINAITELANMKRDSINIYQLSAIASALGITDLNKIISLKS